MRREVLLFAVLGVASGADVTATKPPCQHCTLDASVGTDPVPLVVVLHGDGEDARDRAKPWREAVRRRGWALLALDCPDALGCADGSWYRWNRDTKWVRDQVREVTQQIPIDTTRIYLVGWSGGATYIGKRLQGWPQMFAAVVIHGGGVPPRDHACPDRPFPAYFLVGDKNPAHGAARRLRDYFERCAQDVQWDLLPGANHAKEDAALTTEKVEEILRWLASRRRVDAWS